MSPGMIVPDDDEKQQGLRTEVLSVEPRVSLIHNFLSNEECEHLINIARPHMARSKVNSNITDASELSKSVSKLSISTGVVRKFVSKLCISTGVVSKSVSKLSISTGVVSNRRTSSGTFLKRGQDEVVKVIEKRIADFISIPIERGENLQVLHYAKGQKFEPHLDCFSTNIPENGGQRIATFLMYLSDVKQGGETVFPKAKGKGKFSNLQKGGLVVKPKKGTAVLFWDTLPDGTVDPLSMHGGSPVMQGDKWACTKWIRASEVKSA